MGYDEVVRSEAKSDRGWFDRIKGRIPLYKGYRDKNLRREMDLEVRDEVVRSLGKVKTVMADLQSCALELGDLDSMKKIEKTRTKLDTYIKKIDSAESGYSGFYAAAKTEEEELDAVMEWDAKLLDNSADMLELAKRTLSRIDMGDEGALKAELRNLERFLDSLIDDFEQRDKVLKGLSDGETGREEEMRKLSNKMR